VIYTHVAVAVVAGAVAFGAAWRVQSWRYDSAKLEALEQSRETEKMRRQAAGKAATAHEREKVVIREKFVPIREEVERVVIQYRDSVCLPDDGLRVLRDAIDRANGNPGKPSDPVPASTVAP
jgi:hypothetical protein